jgi:hypothetical protein
MKRRLLAVVLLMTPFWVQAQTKAEIIKTVVDGHVLPGFARLATQAGRLSEAANRDCNPASTALRAAYGQAFDAWVTVSHLRFGPTEFDDRAFAFAFWPDSRGATPRALNELLSNQDPIAASATSYAEVSIAARGFYALEFLLYDDTLMSAGDATYHCTLIQTITDDIASLTQAISDDWQSSYAAILRAPSAEGIYRSEDEVLQELFKALATGLQFTSETRLGGPLGTFDRPRPTRAEVWRSGRSASHVILSLEALQMLANHLAVRDPALSAKLDQRFERARMLVESLDDPVFATIADPQGRLKVEVIQQSVDAVRSLVRDELGPTLGVAAGFNALDGD